MKIICVGRNYIEHIQELGNNIPSELIFFLKPDSSLLLNNQPFFIPDFSHNIHYEVELVIKINRLGKHIQPKFAYKYYDHIAVGIDFTARDIQNKLKKGGLPWEKSKAFDQSAVVSNFLPIKEVIEKENINFRLEKNDILVQEGNSRDMIFGFNYIVSYVSQFVTLKIGDLIFSGTPAGEGKVMKNDNLKAYLGIDKMMDFSVK